MIFVIPTQQKLKPDIDRLINDYSQNLTRFCYLYLKDYHLAEDAVQDTLIKAYTKYSTFKNKCSEKTWITKIAINVCKNYIRGASYKNIVASKVLLQIVTDKESTLRYRDEESILLLNTIFTLPEIYKQVILLFYYQELSTTEISKILGQKEGTISVRLKRAKESLKHILEEE